jgi:hypothetical protein
MIETWLGFNENKDNIREIISKKLSEVREQFYELEDLGIVRYSVINSGSERGGISYFDPKLSTKMGDIDQFLDYILPVVKFDREVIKPLTSKSQENTLILVDIKLPGESNEFGSTVIAREGLSIFDDIISGSNRLITQGYNVKLDLNSSHGEYKPIKILVYFNIKDH